MDKFEMICVNKCVDEFDIVEALISNGGVVQDGDIIAGSEYPLKTYPSNHHLVAFHKVWILVDDLVVPEAEKNLPEFLLELGYAVESLIRRLVRTRIEIACIKDDIPVVMGSLEDCYRFELKFDTNIVSTNITKEAFEKAILEYRVKTSS